jgi:hypothetical protein
MPKEKKEKINPTSSKEANPFPIRFFIGKNKNDKIDELVANCKNSSGSNRNEDIQIITKKKVDKEGKEIFYDEYWAIEKNVETLTDCNVIDHPVLKNVNYVQWESILDRRLLDLNNLVPEEDELVRNAIIKKLTQEKEKAEREGREETAKSKLEEIKKQQELQKETKKKEEIELFEKQ